MNIEVGQKVHVPGVIEKVYGQADSPSSYAIVKVGETSVHFATCNVQTQAAPAPKITLWYFRYCDNDENKEKYAWFESESEADDERKRMIDEDDYDPGKDYNEEYDIGDVECAEVQMTAEGLLRFATNYASNE